MKNEKLKDEISFNKEQYIIKKGLHSDSEKYREGKLKKNPKGSEKNQKHIVHKNFKDQRSKRLPFA